MSHGKFQFPSPHSVRFCSRHLLILVLASLMAACGGGGGGDGSGTPAASNTGTETTPGNVPGAGAPGTGSNGGTGGTTSETGNGLAIETDRTQTSPGGANITLTANIANNPSQTQWSLAPGSPGTLSGTSGGSVEYIPPPAGSVNVNNIVNIIAINGNVTNNIVIALAGNATANNGTQGAGTITPPAGGSTPPAATGIFLIAGNDFGAGDADGVGTSARFDTPSGIARDGQGNLYVADRGNNVIRKVGADGTVATLAGTPGARGNADGQGAAARFSAPSGIAVDNNGNIYVTDHGNQNIRKITPYGAVSTLAGKNTPSGQPGADAQFGGNPMGIAVDASGTLFVTDGRIVRKITPAGSVSTIAGRPAIAGAQDGPATTATFTQLNGVTVDSAGNIYVVDGGFVPGPILSNDFSISASIRKITPGGTVSTLAGTGGNRPFSEVLGYADGAGAQARFRYPEGVTVDRAGNLFVTDRGNHVIRRVAPDGTVSTVAGVPDQPGSTDGPIAAARFMAPAGIVVDADGVLYLSDTSHHTLRKLVPGGSVSTIAGAAPLSGSADGIRSAALFNEPLGIAHDANGVLYVADSRNHTLRRIAADGTVSTLAGTAGQTGTADGTGSAARFNLPFDLATDPLGNLFISDYANHLIRRATAAGVVSTFATADQFTEPKGVAVDRNANVYVADRSADAILKITPQGQITTFAGGNTVSGDSPSRLFFPQDVAVDIGGNVYVSDTSAVIRKITPDGVVATLAGSAFQLGTQDGIGANARFDSPGSVAVDEDGNVYVADSRAIRKISPLGVVTTVAGPTVGAPGSSLRNIHQPSGLVLTGPKTLAFTSGNGVFELRLP